MTPKSDEQKNALLEFSPEVTAALQNNDPVVALESTIITHGMPWPKNHETAQAVEEHVRQGGAVPATIAIMDGKIKIGLSNDDLNTLARADDVLKLSRADLAFGLAQNRIGSTTVAATMIAAKLANIEVFATGGIGGVHRDGENTLDISADLGELAKTGVIVVCAGAKAILDIERTLEVLETSGVPVVTLRNDMFPAFWSRSSGIKTPLRLDGADKIANFWRVRKMLCQQGGLLVANPVPVENEIPRQVMENHIAQAIALAEKSGIKGKEVTPWLLSKILKLTKGEALETNIALICNNARLAAEIAVQLAQKN